MNLNERQIKEMYLALFYAEKLGHGTDGHNRLILIAKLARQLGFERRGEYLYQDGAQVNPVQGTA